MVIGGVLASPEIAHSISQQFTTLNGFGGQCGSIQWKNLSKGNLPRYKRAIDFFFEQRAEQRIDFCAVVLDSHKFDHATYNKGGWEEGFNKFMFQYFFRWFRIYGPNSSLRCFPDYRTSKQHLNVLQSALNGAYQKRKTKFNDAYVKRPFIEVKYSSTKIEPLLQISDILLGAIGFYWNGKDGICAPHSPKLQLAKYVQTESGLSSLAMPTQDRWPYINFCIWKFDL